jgi:hypothetical protein
MDQYKYLKYKNKYISMINQNGGAAAEMKDDVIPIPIFCYGSNNIVQLSERLRRPITKEDTIKAFMRNTVRVFANSDKALSQGKKGVATLINVNNPNETVLGFVFYALPSDIGILNEAEGVKFNKYIPVLAPVVLRLGTMRDPINKEVYAITYVMSPDLLRNGAKQVPPDAAYLDKICQTISLHWKKKDGAIFRDFNREDINLHPEIKFTGVNPEHRFTYGFVR